MANGTSVCSGQGAGVVLGLGRSEHPVEVVDRSLDRRRAGCSPMSRRHDGVDRGVEPARGDVLDHAEQAGTEVDGRVAQPQVLGGREREELAQRSP